MDYFSGIVGQERAIGMLKEAISNKRINHAYLFVGAEGIGKMLTAEAFARTIIHQADENAVLYFNQGLHPDLLIINRLEKRTVITKEQISQEMEPWLGLKPYRASNRIVIIQNGDLMSLEAANALLKILEEPPEYGVIIMVADEKNLLETIISRCQLVRFFAVNDEEIEKFLIDKGFDQKVSYRCARLGQGSIANALLFAGEEEFQELWNTAAVIIQDLYKGQIIEVFNTAEKLDRNPLLIINMIDTILRDVYIYKETKNKELIFMVENMDLINLINGVNSQLIMKCLEQIHELKGNYKRNVNSLLISTNISFKLWETLQKEKC